MNCYSSFVIHSKDAAFNNSHIPSPDSLVPENEKKRKRETGQHKNVMEKLCYSKINNISLIYYFIIYYNHRRTFV